jgi:peptidoglycan/LPS O-acetylase OafA/YrhL
MTAALGDPGLTSGRATDAAIDTTRFNLGLQGMRGIAILLVLLNHAVVPGFQGGYVGVDIFFVISGYLIGGLLLRELAAHGRIDLWSFYARRFRRLLPAFAVVLIAVLCAVPALYAPFEHGELMSSARASALYAANLWFASRSTNYFGGYTEANPLLHLWSLAVEEQFYLFWPLLMLGAARLFSGDVRRTTFWLVVTAGLLSLLACIMVSAWKPQYAFFLTPTRIWQFAAGMLLAIRPVPVAALGPATVSMLGIAALLAIAGATVFFDATLAFPGYWALIPTVASMALLVVVQRGADTWVCRLLRNGPLRWIGDCSYSVYLWHWPLMIFAAVIFLQHGVALTSALIGASVLVGWLSYRWVELPFKHGLLNAWSPRRVVAAGLLLCVAMAAVAHGVGRLKLDARQERYLKATEWPAATQAGCLAVYDAVDQPACEFGALKSATTVVLFGDSHAMQWFLPLQALAVEQGWRFITLTKAQCPGIDVVVNYQGKHLEYWQCTQWREAMLARIENLKPDLVLLANSSGYGIEPQAWGQGLSSTVKRLQAAGLKLAYLRDTPHPGFHVPTCLARAQWRGQRADSLCVYPAADRARFAELFAAETEALLEPGVETLDLFPAFCSQTMCPTEKDGVIMFKDRNHISADYALALKPVLGPQLQRLLAKPAR